VSVSEYEEEENEAFELIELEDELGEDEETPSVGRIELFPERADKDERLDKFIAQELQDLSRSYVQKLIDEGAVTVDGYLRQRTFKVTPGQTVVVEIPEPVEHDLVPEDIPLQVVFEHEDLVVIEKAAAMVVHPAPGHPRGTLVNALIHRYPEIEIAGTNRPGIVHRLDKDTSGLMVVALTDRGRRSLVEQWSRGQVTKGYIALVKGVVEPDQATVDAPIGRDPKDRQRMAAIANGRHAVTHFTVNRRFREATLLDLEIETGRTHQIRVHLAFIGHPVVGDQLYNHASGRFGGTGSIVGRQFLHAAKLAFRLPEGTPVEFNSPLPDDLEEPLSKLRSERLLEDQVDRS
jgi:23S rRNA pseudouridine1911/1915/1917 synthase